MEQRRQIVDCAKVGGSHHCWYCADWYPSGLDSKIKWRPDDEELKAMDPAFQPHWKEFFQDRPDKAVAIFTALAGCVHIACL
jgi:hypothetical protein